MGRQALELCIHWLLIKQQFYVKRYSFSEMGTYEEGERKEIENKYFLRDWLSSWVDKVYSDILNTVFDSYIKSLGRALME